jgi:hypothetical protein
MTSETITRPAEPTAEAKPKPYDPHWSGERLIPRRIVIETIFGCNATCGMCVINHPTEREKGVMPMHKFTLLIDKLAPHRETVELFDLFGHRSASRRTCSLCESSGIPQHGDFDQCAPADRDEGDRADGGWAGHRHLQYRRILQGGA